MRAPKCKICQTEHWGVCYTPVAEVKAAVAKVPAKKPAPKKRPAAKKTTKPKAKKA